jgi:hypothetical protein
MGFDTSSAVTEAANSAEDSAKAAIRALNNEGPLTEVRLKPVLNGLIQRWQQTGSTPVKTDPTLHPILILESVRLAEAINRLEPLPGTETEIGLLPTLTQASLVAGTMPINRSDLLNMKKAKSLLRARPNQTQDIQEAGDLIEQLAIDCDGPLSTVYGV